MKTLLRSVLLLICSVLIARSDSLNSVVTYQGRLNGASGPLTGIYDLQLSLWTSPTGTVQKASTLLVPDVPVNDGLFTVNLDFGPGVFDGSALWLQIAVRTNGFRFYTVLSPRQPLAATPYAHFAPSSGTASGVTAGGITSTMLSDSAVTSAKISPQAVKTVHIDDAGETAYATMTQRASSIAPIEPLPFSGLIPYPLSRLPALAFQLDGSTIGTVLGASGSEAISSPCQFVVEVVLPAPELQADLQLGRTGRLMIERSSGPAQFSGIVTGCALASWDGQKALYTFRIESPLAYLALTSDYKVYQSAKVPELAATLYQTLSGRTANTILSRSYAPRDLIIQYSETTLNFFNRLLEQNGVFYFYNGENLVLGDDIPSYFPCATPELPYFGNTATNSGTSEFIRSFHKSPQETVRKVSIRTYDHKRPQVFPSGSSTRPYGVGEFYQFGAHNASTLNEEAALVHNQNAQKRLVHFGTANCPDLRPGATFNLADQSNGNLQNTYLVTAVRHALYRRSTTNILYGNEFEAIPATEVFHPRQKTPTPVATPCTATVTGASGDDIHVDDLGRVKVLFHWDRHSAANNTASAWIRTTMPMAGSGRAVMFLPHVGDEVLVQFLNGNPDEPVITGSLFNSINVPPVNLPTQKGISTIKSRSTPTAGTDANEIRFGDTSGQETLDLRAAKDFTLRAANDSSISSGHNMVVGVGGILSVSAQSVSLSAANGVGISTPPDPAFSLKAGGAISAAAFSGNGAQLTNLNATALTGTVAEERLSANIARLNRSQVFTADTAFQGHLTIGSAPVIDSLNVSGNARLNDSDLYLRGNGGDTAHGLGWYGSEKPFGSSTMDGPVLYGLTGGALGTIGGGQKAVLNWNYGGNVGIGVANPVSRLDVNGSITATGLVVNGSMSSTGLVVNGEARITGPVRLGSETGSAQAPNRGIIVRRVNSTSIAGGQVLARTDALVLERDGTTSGLRIRYGALPGVQTISALGISNTGTVVPFHTTLNSPAAAGTVQIFTTAQRITHAQITFGNAFNAGHFTQVVIDRHDDALNSDDTFWIGTLTSTYNQ